MAWCPLEWTVRGVGLPEDLAEIDAQISALQEKRASLLSAMGSFPPPVAEAAITHVLRPAEIPPPPPPHFVVQVPRRPETQWNLFAYALGVLLLAGGVASLAGFLWDELTAIGRLSVLGLVAGVFHAGAFFFARREKKLAESLAVVAAIALISVEGWWIFTQKVPPLSSSVVLGVTSMLYLAVPIKSTLRAWAWCGKTISVFSALFFLGWLSPLWLSAGVVGFVFAALSRRRDRFFASVSSGAFLVAGFHAVSTLDAPDAVQLTLQSCTILCVFLGVVLLLPRPARSPLQEILGVLSLLWVGISVLSAVGPDVSYLNKVPTAALVILLSFVSTQMPIVEEIPERGRALLKAAWPVAALLFIGVLPWYIVLLVAPAAWLLTRSTVVPGAFFALPLPVIALWSGWSHWMLAAVALAGLAKARVWLYAPAGVSLAVGLTMLLKPEGVIEYNTALIAGPLVLAWFMARIDSAKSLSTIWLSAPLLTLLIPSAMISTPYADYSQGFSPDLRAALVLLAALLLLGAGYTWQLAGPVVAGSSAALLVAVTRAWPYVTAWPNWVTLLLAGFIVLALATQHERLFRSGKRASGWLSSLR